MQGGGVKCLSCTQPVLKFNDVEKEHRNTIAQPPDPFDVLFQ